MTLSQIIAAALEQLGRTTDSQQQAEWRDKFTQIINEGLMDLAPVLRLRRTDSIAVVDGEIDIQELPYRCLKVLNVTQAGGVVTFTRGSSTYKLKTEATGDVSVEYRYAPNLLSSDTDTPGIPEVLHPLLVTYLCAREYQTSDENTQRRSNPFYAQYAQGKTTARRDYGEPETYKFYNTGW